MKILLKLFFSLQNKGWNAGSKEFSAMVNNNSSRAKFVQQSVIFLTNNNFDGLDLDWEYPGKS